MIRSIQRPLLGIGGTSLLLSGLAMILLARSRGWMWLGEWAWTADWANGLPLAGGPFLAAMTATVVYRYRDLGVHHLAYQTSRGPWLLRALLGAAVLGALAAWGVITLTMMVLTSARSAIGPRHISWLILGIAVLLGYGAVGVLLGRAINRPWVAPVTFVVTFALSYAAPGGSVPPIFRVGGSAGTLAGQTVDTDFILWACAIHLALVILALLVLGLDKGRSHLRRRWISTGLIGAAVLTLAVPGTFGSQERLTNSPSTEYVCAGTVVLACMAEDTASRLPVVAALVDRYASELNEIGVDTPPRFMQSLPGHKVAERDGLMSLGAQTVNTGANLDATGASLVSTPAACPQYFGEEAPESALQAQVILEAYLRNRVDAQKFPAPNAKVQHWFDTKAEAWTVATYEKLMTCELGGIETPSL